MSENAMQLLGLGLLFAGVAGIWVYNARRGLDIATAGARLYLLLAAFTIVGGFVGATAWWVDYAPSFAWDLPPLASRLLAAAALAFGVSGFVALQRPTVAHVRYHALTIAIYLGPLAVAILLFHLDRFDLSAAITAAFFAIVVPMTAASLWLTFFPRGLQPEQPGDVAPPRPETMLFLRVAVAVFGLWAIALFAVDDGPSRLVWVWPGDLLTSRLIAVMPLTLAATSLASLRSALLARTTLVLVAVYGAAGAIAGLMNAAAGKPVPMLYVTAFAAFGLAAAILLFGARARR